MSEPLNEVILSIEETDNFFPEGEKWSGFEGYIVQTDKQKIMVLISNSSSCCESWGHLSTPDDPKEFVGAKLLKVEVVDTAYDKKAWDAMHPHGLDCGEATFVNFETDKGLFQLTVYDSHNGYYGHSVVVRGAGLDKAS